MTTPGTTDTTTTTGDGTPVTEEPKATSTSTDTEGTATGTSTDAKPDTDSEDTLGEKGQRALAEERKARKAAEKAAKDLETRLRAIEDEKLSDQEKVARERDELKTKYEQLTGELKAVRAEKAISKAIKAAKVTDENAVTIADLVRSEDFDDDADNAAELVADVKRRHPHLFKPAAPGPVDTGTGKGAAPSNARAQMGAFLAGRSL